jgi:chaperonin GroES
MPHLLFFLCKGYVLMSKIKLRPLDDRIVIEPDEAEAVSPGGIVLPDVAQEKPQRGLVVAVGPGKLLGDGSRAAPSVSPGDKVVFTKYGGTKIEIHGIELLIVKESDLLAVLS